MFTSVLFATKIEDICVPCPNPFFVIMLEGRFVDPGPSIKDLPFGHEFHSRMHTSYAILPLKIGRDESNAVSRIATVGVIVLLDRLAALDEAGTMSDKAINAVIIFLFMWSILLKIQVSVNSYLLSNLALYHLPASISGAFTFP